MFVDTLELKTAREFVARDLEIMLNSVENGIATRRSHPTFVTKTALRDNVMEMRAIFWLWCKAGGNAELEGELAQRYYAMIQRVGEAGIKI